MLIGNRFTTFRSIGCKFQYIRIDVYANGGQEPHFQMSSVRFLDKKNNLFQYPNDKICTDNYHNLNEDADKMFRNTLDGKWCSSQLGSTHHLYAICNLNSVKIDINIYNRWQWYTSNDTRTYSDRNATHFTISFSNDGENWIKYDEQLNYRSAPAANYSLGYTGNLRKM